MRTYLQSKAMAGALRECLVTKNVSLSHADCLEIVARQFGFHDWNTLASRIRVESMAPAAPAGGVMLKPPIPVLRVTSIAAAREFYVDFLGFEFDWGDEEPLRPDAYAQVSRNGVQLHLAQESQGGKPAALLFRDMTGLTALHRELVARSARFSPTDIRITPWDSREFDVTDPFGNHLRFWENNPPGFAG
jgi:catechol 2,3-dioxygenase-like lactoylglutathione lyase family enzyme